MDKVVENNPALFRAAMSKEGYPMVSTSQCHYDKGRKVLRMSSEVVGMPLTFWVRSHHTGKIVRFVPVNPADSLYDEDQWDGEQQIYKPIYSCLGVDHFVIYND